MIRKGCVFYHLLAMGDMNRMRCCGGSCAAGGCAPTRQPGNQLTTHMNKNAQVSNVIASLRS